MLFHTPAFIVFLIVVFTLWSLTPRAWYREVIILLASLFFYGFWDVRFLPLLVGVWVLTWLTINRMHAAPDGSRKRAMFSILGVVLLLAILAIFKYVGFFGDVFGGREQLAALELLPANLLDSVAPLGLSFVTFQAIGLIVDYRRGELTEAPGLFATGRFLTFFPQLIAGPIERYTHLAPQLEGKALAQQPPIDRRIATGLTLFAIGFFRKAVGDLLGFYTDPIFDDIGNAEPHLVMLGLLGFTLQIYFDFAGYSEMARGIGRLFGVDLAINFRAPYFARNIQDFWRRWNMTLSFWFRDYLYIPLGGSRLGVPRHVLNLFVTMTLCGLWHGAAINFVVWGALHAIFQSVLVLKRLALPRRRERGAATTPADWISSVGARILTLLCVIYAWMFFRIRSAEDLWIAHEKLGAFFLDPIIGAVNLPLMVLIGCCFALDGWIERRGDYVTPLGQAIGHRRLIVWGLLSAVLICAGALILSVMPARVFIYFEF
ncbi:MBOAT family O-acyltransferase [Amorphus orientalis]|uniref:Probable alginate O-acetylase AlgI n=1 Tax=Amorphus orientalis TaxID=649198 RepID=A0AAE4ASF1_9HYPH|nr:MBOAT family O-acyltransferase [Amorphus orientalis]MDQ0316196.1 D-alanyl-lipoteichoic acid acyltransferase DltB (MBOAT superfamily) [Amorphus orientalis]